MSFRGDLLVLRDFQTVLGAPFPSLAQHPCDGFPFPVGPPRALGWPAVAHSDTSSFPEASPPHQPQTPQVTGHDLLGLGHLSESVPSAAATQSFPSLSAFSNKYTLSFYISGENNTFMWFGL